ncbi:hypothetical protein DAMNIGENAA_35870 [Desulforhabdus amnigena]|jgi:cysteine desulfurase NifS|uniref:cysteine desulfurase n=1 Tax=Desulforhabdus amnigena TaxID=40218 RepID=A0A9W6FWC8_9BACT|nr:hypothetical protein DAMNIGENAA_35870 [Desulforhabdus amnigena]
MKMFILKASCFDRFLKGNLLKTVTAAILIREGRILIARRRAGTHQEFKWEFPGGKVEVGETPEECLKREIKEELQIEVRIGAFLWESIYHYSQDSIRLLAYETFWESGEMVPTVHEAIEWVSVEDMKDYDFAPADIPFVRKLIERKTESNGECLKKESKLKPIYLDYNATTPIDPQVAGAMLPFIHEHFGNPSSSHVFGTKAKSAVERARKQIAEVLHCTPDEFIFTSGGSESNNYAIKGVARAYLGKGNHIITSSVEHPAVTEVCRYLEGLGYEVTYLPVDSYGRVNLQELEEAITPKTILITVMHANNEVGTIEPIREISLIAHRHGILVHTDAAQSIGKIPVHVDDLGVDLLSVAGHKLYAPKGIGGLFIRSGVRLEKLIHGANHERNMRAGTENVIEIVGLGEAFQMVGENSQSYREHLQKMRDLLETRLKGEFADIRINGHPEMRLPNTSSVSFKGVGANVILAGMRNVAASAGAACHSEGVQVSSVLKAMGIPLEYAMGTIRFSVGRFTTAEEIDRAMEDISSAVRDCARQA